MREILDGLRLLKPWQIGALVVVLLGAVGVTYGVYTLVSGSGQADLAANQ